jgi:hypothetical protein
MSPAGFESGYGDITIPFSILRDLGFPELAARSWQFVQTASMAVPEAAMNMDGCAISS